MKKIIALLLCLLFCMSIIACNNDTPDNNDDQDTGSQSVDTTEPVTDAPAEPKSIDLKLLSNNIMINNTRERAALLKTAYTEIDADVLALQEVDDNWYDVLGIEAMLGELGYTAVPIPEEFKSDIYGPDDDQAGRNAIFYKTDKFELVDHGRKLYDAFNYPGAMKNGAPLYGYRSYSYTWALLKEKSTGLQFVAISTHMNAGIQHLTTVPEGMTAEEYEEELDLLADQHRTDSAKELVKAIADLEAKYDCPVVAVGDYNSNLESEAYAIMNEALKNGREDAAKKANGTVNTACSIGSRPGRGKNLIDQCFYSNEGITGNYFAALLTSGTVNTFDYADHIPVYFEFTLHE